ncbi:MAG TPA: hypothetical protein VIJ93_13685, partial [bacterium]
RRKGRHGVFLARFVGLIRPWTGLLAGIWKTPWRPFLLYNLAGSVAYACLYTLAGNLIGKEWAILKTWIGKPTFYMALGIAVLLFLCLFFRRPLRAFFAGFSPKKGNRSRK